MALPDIVALRPSLVPEFSVCASDVLVGVEEVTAGITDRAGKVSLGARLCGNRAGLAALADSARGEAALES